MVITNAYSVLNPVFFRGRIHGTYFGHARPNGIRNGEPIITTPVVKTSKNGRRIETQSGSKYQLRLTAPK